MFVKRLNKTQGIETVIEKVIKNMLTQGEPFGFCRRAFRVHTGL